MAIVAGRELYGYTKVDADITFVEEDEAIHATIGRDGTTFVDAVLRLGEPVEPIPRVPSMPSFNMKWIPSVEQGAPPEVMQLNATTLGNYTFTELRPGEATLTFGSTDLEPLENIPILQILGAAYTVSNFILDYGKVVYDYLDQGKDVIGLSKNQE